MKRIILLLSAVFLLLGCARQASEKESKALSWGQIQTVYVFADDNTWNAVEKPLKASLGRTVTTTDEEPWFDVKRADIASFDKFYRFSNIIFFYAGDAVGPANERAGELLGSAVSGMPADSAAIFTRDNLWCRDQFVMFVTAGSDKKLFSYTEAATEHIYRQYASLLLKRMAARVYQPGVRPDKELNGLPWKADIPFTYALYRHDPNGTFRSYLYRQSEHADRYFAVYSDTWDGKGSQLDWAVKTRNRIIGKYYEGDSIAVKEIKSEETTLGSYKALKIWGRWQNHKYYVGGAFQTFVITDPSSRKVFFVDNSVFFPDGMKLDALLELESISATFRIR